MQPGSCVTSGFADEIDADLEVQLDTLDRLGIDYLDLRGVEDTNVLDLSDGQIERVQRELDERGIGVTSIGSPIGKVDIEEPFEPHFERFQTAVRRAEQFDTEYIRLFSYYTDEPTANRGEVMRRMERKAEYAEDAGVTLLLENEKDLYGDTPGRVRDVLTTVDSPNLRAIFDPANYLEIGVEAYPDALLQVVEYVEQLHIKDANKGSRGDIEPAGEGDGHIPETLAVMAARGFHGVASLEPHLAEAGRAGGFSGPEAYGRATEALRDCFDEAGVDYE